MQVEQKRRLLEQSLERVVEQIGDITQPTMARYYGRFPSAVAPYPVVQTGCGLGVCPQSRIRASAHAWHILRTPSKSRTNSHAGRPLYACSVERACPQSSNSVFMVIPSVEPTARET